MRWIFVVIVLTGLAVLPGVLLHTVGNEQPTKAKPVAARPSKDAAR